MSPTKFGTFEFDPKAQLKELWKVLDPRGDGCAYAYLITTAQPIDYQRRRSRIVYIGKGGGRDDNDYYRCEALMGLAAVIAWLCDPEDNYCGRGPRRRDRAEIVKQFRTDSLKIQLHLLPCRDVGTDNPILFEGALLQAFEKLHGELPKFNCRHEAPADESRDAAEQVVLAFAASPGDTSSGDATRDL